MRHFLHPVALFGLVFGLIACLGCFPLQSRSSFQRQANGESDATQLVRETESDVFVFPEGVDHDAAWEAALDTLRRRQYRPDRVDLRNGIITTRPVVSEHFFEWWRKDVATYEDWLESGLNPIRRSVDILMARPDDGSPVSMTITVRKERLSSPDRQFNNSGAAYRFFSATLPSTTGIVNVTAQYDTWLPRGTDPAMAKDLAGIMLERAERSTLAMHDSKRKAGADEPAPVSLDVEKQDTIEEPTGQEPNAPSPGV